MKKALVETGSIALVILLLLLLLVTSVFAAYMRESSPLVFDEPASQASEPQEPQDSQWSRTDDQTTQATAPGPVQPGPKLHLAAGSFDPLRESPSNALPDQQSPGSSIQSTDDYYIIQFHGPITESDKRNVAALGVEFFDYVPDFGFVVRMDAATADTVATLESIRWVGALQPGLRVEPSLAANKVHNEISNPIETFVVVFKGENVAGIAQELETMGGLILDVAETHWKGKIRVEVDAARLPDIANLPGVKWVETAPISELNNNKAADVMDVRPVWDTHGLYGAGQIVGVCDTGLDEGSVAPANLHDDFEDGSGTSRVIALYDLVGSGDGAEDNDGHGTHVAGSVLGNGDLSGATPASHDFPSTCYAGMAPDAQLVFQAVGNDAGGLEIPSDLNTLFAQAYNDGARLHNNSWSNVTTYGLYNSNSREVDEFAWDYPDFLPFFSASNEGTDSNSDGIVDLVSTRPPGTAKNCVSVGATENNRPSLTATWGSGWPADFPANPINSDRLADDPDGLAGFSGRGYTLDGRLKPDIAAPGTYVASTRSRDPRSGTGWGEINEDYIYMGGTSMSTPLTTGAATLAREFFATRETYAPSAALLKATLVNGATDIYPGQYGTGTTQEITLTRPSPQAGWGRLDLENSLFPPAPRRTWYWDSTSVMTSSLNHLSTGDTASYTFEVSQSKPLSVTLAWTDYPGSPLVNGGLVNDLDLKIEGPGATMYYPNQAQQTSLYHLSYDDGSENSATGSSTVGREWGVRFTPGRYPVTLDKALFTLYRTSSGALTFDVYIRDDDSGSGLAGADLCSLTHNTTTGSGWFTLEVDLSTCDSGSPVTINSGDFYIVLRLVQASDPWMAYDTNTPIDNRSWWGYNGSAGTLQTDREYMITAIFEHTATSQDRVNNLVGIDIPNPPTGTYTVTISGYNVPFGPQPYALVLSGVGRPLGTETVTRTIPSVGTYKFGNTGVTIEFTSESLDAVAVTVYRDQYATSSTKPVKRYYEIEPIGGSSFNANVTFSYEQAEFEAATGGFSETEILPYRWDGGQWVSYTVSSRNTADNTYTANGITAFSKWGSSDNGGGFDGATGVILASFTASAQNGAIHLSWTTATELDILGFDLYRSDAPDGVYTKLNDKLIASQSPGSPVGASYTWTDATMQPNTPYYYKLEIVNTSGSRTEYGPVSAFLEKARHLIYLPLVTRP